MRTRQDNSPSNQSLNRGGFGSTLSPADAAAFEALKITTTYPSGAVLFVEGETPRGVFMLASGRAKVSISSPSGKIIILKIAQPGEVLELHAVVSHSVFQAAAQTIEPSQISFVRQDHFLNFLHDHPQAALEAAKQLSANYQDACGQLRGIGLCGSAKEKVARFVLEWTEKGELRSDGVRATLTLTHEEIGQLIGISRETITRVLGDFKSRRWISFRDSILMIRNRGALEALLGFDSYSHAETVGRRRGYVNPLRSVSLAEARP